MARRAKFSVSGGLAVPRPELGGRGITVQLHRKFPAGRAGNRRGKGNTRNERAWFVLKDFAGLAREIGVRGETLHGEIRFEIPAKEHGGAVGRPAGDNVAWSICANTQHYFVPRRVSIPAVRNRLHFRVISGAEVPAAQFSAWDSIVRSGDRRGAEKVSSEPHRRGRAGYGR